MRVINMLNRLPVALVASVTAMAVMAGCVEPEEINRVQPDLIEKGSLTGEWYGLSTVVRAPYASHYVFPGLQGDLERGVWEVAEDHLYLYRTYEFVEGVEVLGMRGDSDLPLLDTDGNPVTYEKVIDGETRTVTRYIYRSSPIRRYAILGHFDVRKKYNPLTGKQSNVVTEDSSEKFWYQRNYMRVDFGKNSAVNFADIGFDKRATVIYEGQEGPEDLKLRVADDGTYMDFVNRGFVTAPRMYLYGWGFVPTCLFFPSYTGSYYECDEEELHIRSAFMKVEENNSYTPLDYSDDMLNKFGFYTSARASHDEHFGRTYDGAIRNIRRFRIWDEYLETADGGMDYAAMTARPVVYYLSEDFPRELIPGAKDLATQWSEPFTEVVENLKGAAPAHDMFILCENSTAEADAAVAMDPNAELASTDERFCKDMDEPKRFGDLRYNLLVSVNDPVQYGLYGYGPMHSDPITGETVHANAFNYSANMRLGTRTAVDMIEYAAGVQNFRDITQARHITTSIEAKSLKGSQGAPKREYTLEAARERARMAVTPNIQAQMAGLGMQGTDTDMAAARMNRLLHTNDFNHLWLNSDMAALAGLPSLELGAAANQDAGFLNSIVNPANLGSEKMMRWQLDQDYAKGRKSIDMGEFFDDSFWGLALEYKSTYDSAICSELQAAVDGGDDLIFDFDAFREPGADCSADAGVCGENQACTFIDQGDFSGNYCMTACSAGALFGQLRTEIRRVNQISQFVYWDPNALYTDTKDARVAASQLKAREIVERIREEVFLDVYDRFWSTVAMHEVGHNVGLRHNFASSTDALNFFDKYWELKGSDDGNGWKATKLWEDDTRSQAAQGMREFQQTSIMEYSGAFNARFQGLGSYDRAAILFGYGKLVEVFDNAPAFAEWEDFLDDPSFTRPDQYPLDQRREAPLARALRKVHHTNFPELFGGVDAMTSRHVVSVDDIADKSKPCSRNDNPYDTEVCGGGGSFCQPYPDGFFCSKADMVEVPFRFCSDEYNWSQPTCQSWDEGVDVFEIVNNAIDDYDAYWPFRAYQRDNALFSPSTGYWGGVVRQMYGFRKQFEHWALSYARYNKGDWWETKYGMPWHEDINGGLGATLAATNMFEFLANIFGRPNDSYYGFNEQRKRYEPIIDNGRNTYCNVFQIREDQGARPMYPAYDFSGYMYTPARAGTFYDRLAAMMYMTYPTTMFTVGVDRGFDLKRFRLNFASIWPQRMHNLFSGLLTSDPNMFGWCIEHDGNAPVESCTTDPVEVKARKWFGTDAELDAHYANCTTLNPEPEYDFPTTQYRLPALAAIYGYGWMSFTFDRSFIDRNRIWLEGDGTAITIPPGFETIKYTDPFSGKTYVASYDPAEEDPMAVTTPRDAIPAGQINTPRHAYYPSARMLALANLEYDKYGGNLSDLGSEYQYSTLQQTVGRLEIMRGLYRLFEFNY